VDERHVSAMLVRQAIRDLDLSRSSPAVRLNVGGHSPRSEQFPGTSTLSEAVVTEQEGRASLDFTKWGLKTPEAVAEKEIQLETAAADSVGQPPSLPVHDKAIPEAPRKAGSMDKTVQTKRHSAPRTWLVGTLRTDHPIVNSDRSTLALAAIILLALGLWTGWRGLRTRAGAAPRPARANAVSKSTQNQDWTSMLSDMLYSPMASNPERKPFEGNKTRAVQILPQTLLPSKLRPQAATPTEAAPPAVTSNTARIPDNLLPLVSNSRPLPQPLRPSTTAESSSDTKPIDGDQASTRHPIKIVQPKYPKLAEVRHLEGDVLLELHVDSSGKVETVRTVSGNSLFGEAAEEAVRQWQYPPSSGNQPSTSMVTRVRMTFRLNAEPKR